MKSASVRFVLMIWAGLAPVLPAWGGQTVGKDCTFRGVRLWGKVQVVESFPDLKVQMVDSFPDLNVQTVSSFPDGCGKWTFVTSFPDFKIQYVTSFPDIKVKSVSSFPGVP